MEPTGSLLCSQEPTTGSYPQPDASRHKRYITNICGNDSVHFSSYSSWVSKGNKKDCCVLHENL